MVTARQYREALAARGDALAAEIDHLRAERERYQRAADELEAARLRNRRELAGYLLPDLDDEDLAALAARVRLPSLRQAKRPFEEELAAANQERESIEADPRFVQYDVNVVDVEQQLAEIADACASFRAEREPWEKNKHFQELKGRGWFAPDYDGGLWDWLRDWRACSLLMAALEDTRPGLELADDDAVKAAWNKLAEDSDPVLALERSLQLRRADLEHVKNRHAALVAAPAEIFKRCWEAIATQLGQHLEEAPADLLLETAKGDPQLAVFYKKAAGLKKQAQYLRELAATRIDPVIQRFVMEHGKTQQKVQKIAYKIGRGKYVQTPSSLTEVAPPHAKWQKMRGSLAKTRERVATFDRWDRGAFVHDFLWWDLVTHGARGDDLHEVRTFHARHPDWSPAAFVDPLAQGDEQRAADANDLAAASTVDGFADDGVAGGFDPS